jgi:hypothetical protein
VLAVVVVGIVVVNFGVDAVVLVVESNEGFYCLEEFSPLVLNVTQMSNKPNLG